MSVLGKMLKTERLNRDWVLRDMAEELGITPAQLSHIETGRRRLSEETLDKLVVILSYNDVQRQRLKKAAEETYTPSSVKINLLDYNESDQEMLYRFARNFKEIDEKKKEQIRKILNWEDLNE